MVVHCLACNVTVCRCLRFRSSLLSEQQKQLLLEQQQQQQQLQQFLTSQNFTPVMTLFLTLIVLILTLLS